MLHWMTMEQVFMATASLSAAISTVISVLIYRRTRPNRTREAIDAALQPVSMRLDTVFEDVERLRAEQAAGEDRIEEFDREIAKRLGKIDTKVGATTDELGRIKVTLEHIAHNDQTRTLHHRVTEVAKAVAALASQADAQGKQLSLIHDFLLNGGLRSRV